tara:strand:+ start:28 stop:801 length:774 start_codon:yes stop_codon:yes gene_type:complete
MNIKKKLTEIANKYSKEIINEQLLDIDRISYHINLCIKSSNKILPSDLEICDLGGGIGMFSVGCASSEFKRSVLIDDFNDSINHKIGDQILELHKNYGVEIYTRDVVNKGIQDIEGTFDIITSFHSMEHWHNSPKKLFHEVMAKLKKGGIFILSGPNCHNLRKRISVPLGYGKWSSMEGWYEEEKFRGHVREPDVDDLIYIAKDMGLTDIKIIGKNWQGHRGGNNNSTVIKSLTKIIDPFLKYFPSLCSDIYMIGSK